MILMDKQVTVGDKMEDIQSQLEQSTKNLNAYKMEVIGIKSEKEILTKRLYFIMDKINKEKAIVSSIVDTMKENQLGKVKEDLISIH